MIGEPVQLGKHGLKLSLKSVMLQPAVAAVDDPRFSAFTRLADEARTALHQPGATVAKLPRDLQLAHHVQAANLSHQAGLDAVVQMPQEGIRHFADVNKSFQAAAAVANHYPLADAIRGVTQTAARDADEAVRLLQRSPREPGAVAISQPLFNALEGLRFGTHEAKLEVSIARSMGHLYTPS